MILLAYFLFGGIAGAILWIYIADFIPRLQKEVYDTYLELFPKNPPRFQPHFAQIQPKKCGHLLGYFFFAGVIFTSLKAIFPTDFFPLWAGCVLLFIWAISYLDWHYQLISPTPCLWLALLGFIGAMTGFSSLSLKETLESAVGFFLVFYAIYHLAKWYYHQEAFGRGDYWLALGIGSYLPLDMLPQWLLIASLLGITVAFPQRKTKAFLPFAPFMCVSAGIIWLYIEPL